MKRNKLIDFPVIGMYVVALLLVGVMELARAGFSDNIVTNADFWYRVALGNAANLLVLFPTVAQYKRFRKEESEDIQERELQIKDFVENDVEVDLDSFISDENIAAKIFAHKENINAKIKKLDKKSSSEDKLIFAHGTEEDKLNSKYCKSKTELIEQITEEYIYKNILYMGVEYDVLEYGMLTSGYQTNGKVSSPIFEKENIQTMKALLPGMLIAFAAITFISSLILDVQQTGWIAFVMILFRTALLAKQYISGRNYGIKYIDVDYKAKLDDMLRYAKKYMQYKVDKSKGIYLNPLEAIKPAEVVVEVAETAVVEDETKKEVITNEDTKD